MLMTMGPLFRRQLQEQAAGRLVAAPRPSPHPPRPAPKPAPALVAATPGVRDVVRLVAWPRDAVPGGVMLAPQLREALRPPRPAAALGEPSGSARLVYAPHDIPATPAGHPDLASSFRQQIRDTAMALGMTITELTGPCRRRELIAARAELVFLGVAHYRRSLPQIGQALGGRDHTTILHARDRVAAALREAGFSLDEGVAMAASQRRAIIVAHYAKPWRRGAKG
jgi:hypothetical protein